MKYLFAFLAMANACCGSQLLDIVPDPYPAVYAIDPMPYLEHGFYSNARSMAHLIRKHHVKNVIEIGSWLGTSTRHIAQLIPEDGIVIAVDHWKGSIEHDTIPGCKELLPTLYTQFLSNAIHSGLTHKIIPFRSDSLSASKILKDVNIVIDLVYLDGDHTTQAVYEDLTAWFPYVKNHGVICGDDWSWKSVRKGVNRFAKENKLKVHSHENFWYLKKK